MNETLQAIRDEWRGGGLERCLQGIDHGPSYAFTDRGKLKEWRQRFAVRITMRDVDRVVSRVTGLGIEALHANRRAKKYVRPRQLAMLLMQDFCTARSLAEIARHFNKADHTTVMHAITRSEKLLDLDPEFFDAYARARHILMRMQA